jgi:PhzF family phenazine biosynthesis protein
MSFLYQIDAFTRVPFHGNPAAICLLDEEADETWMQSVALEMNLSETAFVRRLPDGTRELRWFTPKVEVDLCGHATLAAAHMLREVEGPANEIVFSTRSGLLTASFEGDRIVLDFPARPASPNDPPAGLLEALGVEALACAESAFDALVEVADEAAVLTCTPDFRALAQIPTRGTILTSLAADGESYVSRFFAPRAGIDEDPATGSAHCTLAPWYEDRLGPGPIRARQLSSRGAVIETTCRGDRVELRGHAVTTLRGHLA